MESIQIDHKTVINTIKLKPNPRRPGDFRTGTVKERPGGYNAAGDRCYVGLKLRLHAVENPPSIFKKTQKTRGRGCLFMGRVEKDLNTLNPLCLKCVLSIPFSILYTVKLLRNVKAEEFLITNDKIKSSFFCSFVLI